jgi:hypothetical protein
MKATAPRARLPRKSVIRLFTALAALGLCAFQFGDRYGLNDLPFTQVQHLVFDPARAESMAKRGNIELDTGQTLRGETVTLRGEFADASCYLGDHTHGYDHAFCAKLCAAAGSPLVFVSDHRGQAYIVLSQRKGVRLPENVLDRIGVPGTVVRGKVFDADGLRALAVEGLEP